MSFQWEMLKTRWSFSTRKVFLFLCLLCPALEPENIYLVLDIVNHLLRQPPTDFSKCTPEEVAELKLKAITLVKTMLEDNSQNSLRLAKQILTILDLETVFDNMVICPDQRL